MGSLAFVVKKGLKEYKVSKLIKKKGTPPVFILQMGKVASQSVWRSLETQYPGLVLHAHGFKRKTNYLYNWQRLKFIEVNYLISQYEQDKLAQLKVISLVREPLGRNVSAFFQNFERDTGINPSSRDFESSELKALFLEKANHLAPTVFFDRINTWLGIDVYATPFPKEGHATFSNSKNVEMLVMKHDLPDELKQKVIGDFVNMPSFHLQNQNIGDQKSYSRLYQQFKKEVRLPESYLQEMKDSRYFRHFYDQDTINQVCEKWSE